VTDLPTITLDTQVFRIISARFPQIDLYERAADSAAWHLLHQIESLTNPRLRDEAGDIRLIPLEDRIFGRGSSWIMAAFAHPPVQGQGGRFNDQFGVFYCAPDVSVATAESSYHRARFLREARITDAALEMRVIRAHFGPEALHDVRRHEDRRILDSQDYSAAQALGRLLKGDASHGVIYPSVRAEGDCLGVMRAVALSGATHWRYLTYRFEQGQLQGIESH